MDAVTALLLIKEEGDEMSSEEYKSGLYALEPSLIDIYLHSEGFLCSETAMQARPLSAQIASAISGTDQTLSKTKKVPISRECSAVKLVKILSFLPCNICLWLILVPRLLLGVYRIVGNFTLSPSDRCVAKRP